VKRGKSQIDGDATPLLFGQAVGINAGKGAHERGLAMVNVTRDSERLVLALPAAKVIRA
jgi:hypothetical protein